MVDLHAHIFPNLDDGAQSLEESVNMAKMARGDGITAMVGTPHLFRGEYHYDNLNIIEQKHRELSTALKEEGIEIQLFRGAEVHISHNLIDEIRHHRDQIVINGSTYLFVEFPSDHVFHGIKNLFFELMSEELTPIIAHPERNSVFVRNPEMLFDLVQMGALCQVNSGSFFGAYGSQAARGVETFLSLKLVHFIATDCHNTQTIRPLLSGSVRRVEEIYGEEMARSLVNDNPRAVLDDRPVPFHPEPISPRDRKEPFRIKIPSFLFKKK
jgi:protein-tyrosine phosphatase